MAENTAVAQEAPQDISGVPQEGSQEATESTVRVFTSTFARRGKGARGTITIETLGQLIGANLDYSHADDVLLEDLVEFIGERFNIVELAMIGYDEKIRENNGEGGQKNQLIDLVLKHGLETDRRTAKGKVKEYLAGYMAALSYQADETMEAFVLRQKRNLEKQTGSKLAPRLVRK